MRTVGPFSTREESFGTPQHEGLFLRLCMILLQKPYFVASFHSDLNSQVPLKQPLLMVAINPGSEFHSFCQM